MNLIKFRSIIMTVVLTAVILSCGKKVPAQPSKPDVKYIDGTELKEGNNLVGKVSDTKGKPIPGVPVTDGYTFTTTDANGVYQFVSNNYARNVYISVPAEYAIPVDPATNIPKFYSDNKIDKYQLNRNDFVLEPIDVEDEFSFVGIGDPQCKTDGDVARWKSETIPDIIEEFSSGEYKNVYAMTLGDIIFDNTAQWGPMKKSMSNVSIGSGKYLPIFQCIGNHDHDPVKSKDFDAVGLYLDHFGPTDYSFDRGEAHIVVMDDVIGKESNGSTWNDYDGGITNIQLEWLRQDLKLVKNKEDKLVIFCCHIPIRASKINNNQAVLNLLSQFKEAHIMSGHTHYQHNWVHNVKAKGGLPIYEHVHGAACGAWWSCNSNVLGGPNGYNIYKIKGNSIVDWVAKGTRKDKSFQLRVYDGNQLYSGKYPLKWYVTNQKAGPANILIKGNPVLQHCFVAEVFNDDNTYWKVELYKDGTKVGDFTRIPDRVSCNVAAAFFYFNVLNKNTSTWASINASHYWYYKPASGKPAGETGWTVKATHTIPSTGQQHVYECSTLTTDITSVF